MDQRLRWLLLLAVVASPASAQVTFTRWDFNAPGLSTTSPAAALANQGAATAHLIGGTIPGASGAFLSDSGSSDVVAGSAWACTNFPAQGSGSGTAGLEFRTSAAGFASLAFEIDVRASTSFSDFYRVEYSLNQGQSWTSFTQSPLRLPGDDSVTANVWTNNVGGSSPAFVFPASANGMGDVRVRLVTVFDPALGNAYSPNSPTNAQGAPVSYATVGFVRVDMVEFKGSVAQSVPPSIDLGASTVSPSQTCTGVATPVSIDLRVSPGAIPASITASATADMTSIGGAASVAMTPAGVDGSGRLRFTLSSNVAPGLVNGAKAIPISVIDDASRTATGTLWLTVGTCCYADLDNDGQHANSGTPDGGVDINDLLFFLTGFEAGASDVDLDNDGEPTNSQPDGGVDINDLLFFLARFEQGC